MVDGLQPEADHRVGRHDRLGDGGRDLSRTAATTFRSSRRKTPSKGPSRFTTTLRSVVALRGPFTYEDHGDAVEHRRRANLNVQIYRPPVATNYRGRASFSDGTVKIQTYEPFRADMQSRFTIDGGIVHFGHIDLRATARGRSSPATSTSGAGRSRSIRSRSKIDFPDAEGDLLPRPELHRRRARATSPARSTSSRAAAS